jgi:VWFA-related protein
MNLSRRSLLSAFTLLPAARFLRAQQDAAPPDAAQPKPTFSADVNVVNIFATVRDKKGQIVHDLTQGDLLLDEEGRSQTIRYFSQESNLPLTLGLLVDTSGSQRNVLNDERSASLRFFQQVLREDRDLAFVIHFDMEVELLQDLTPSRAKLEQALDALEIKTPQTQQQSGGGNTGGGGYPQGGGYPGGGYPGGGSRYPRGGGYPGGGGGGGYPRNGTHLYDAIQLASDEVTKKQKGRKALVLLTDGVDHGSKDTLFESISSAQKADTLVYSVLFADPNRNGNYGGFGGPGMGGRRRGGMGGPMPRGGGEQGPDGKKVLQQIARETGGRFFEVSRRQPIEKVYAAIEEDLRHQYNIGYTPDQKGEPGVYRHIHLATKKKDLVVQAREGYYPAT